MIISASENSLRYSRRKSFTSLSFSIMFANQTHGDWVSRQNKLLCGFFYTLFFFNTVRKNIILSKFRRKVSVAGDLELGTSLRMPFRRLIGYDPYRGLKHKCSTPHRILQSAHRLRLFAPRDRYFEVECLKPFSKSHVCDDAQVNAIPRRDRPV
jgi:hypothetical protein